MAELQLVDVSIRDGNQSLWGATGLSSPQILQILPVVDRVGFRALDFTSSTHMGVAVRTFQEDPWERIRLARAAAPNTPLQFIGTGMRFISWEVSHPDFMRLVYERLVANGISRFVVLDPMHDIDAVLDTGAMIRRAGGREVIAALTFTISEVHDDAFYADLARRMAASPDIDRVYIKDPTGLLHPERARTLVPAVLKALGGTPLEMHCHTTIGLSPLTYLAGAELGVEVLQVACGPLANGSSLPDAQRITANLREHGHTVDVDDRLLARVADYFGHLAQAEGLPAGRPQEYDAAFLRHQVAGGVMTTTRRQLAEIGLEHRFPEVIEEVPRVRAELGYPIMVTPFPQMVCSQALFNVIGEERYGNVSDQVIRYVLGRFGRPTAPVDPDVHHRILSRRRATELQHEPPAVPPDELRARFPAGISDEEFLLRATMPGEQVDAMLAAGRARRHYNPDLAPVLRLLRELTSRPPTELVVETDDLRLTLRRDLREPPMPAHETRPAVAADVHQRLGAVRGFVFDMDGTLVLGDRSNEGLSPLPGAGELIRWLGAHDVPFVVFTNGTGRTPAHYARVLRSVGLAVPDGAMMTPASSAVTVCLERGHRRVVVLGIDGLVEPLREAGIEALPPTGRPQADAVLVGWYREFTMGELEAACHAIWDGARLYSASQSRFFATADGRALGTSRMMCGAITSVTGSDVEVVGKPSLHALHAAAERLGVMPDELAVVGDDPDLEVPMAHAGGALAIAVTSGLGEADSFDHLPDAQQPHIHLEGVGELLALCQAAWTAAG